MNVTTDNWSHRNVWPATGGDLAVRQGLNSVYTASGGYVMLAAWSVRCVRTDTVWHYLIEYLDGSTAPTAVIKILDEDYATVSSTTLQCSSIPPVCTLATVQDQIFIASPAFPTMRGVIGSGNLVRATKVEQPADEDQDLSVIDIPRGICVSWGERLLIADGSVLWASNALQPRSFLAANGSVPAGAFIYGMHVSAGGALLLCTPNGVYGLPEDASSSGQLIIGNWSKLSDHSTTGFGQTAACHGGLYGLTPRGMRRIDVDNAVDVLLDEPSVAGGQMASATVTDPITRIQVADYRQGARMLPGFYGPIVAEGLLYRASTGASGQHAFLRTISATGLRAWTTISGGSANTVEGHWPLVGVLEDQSGAECYAAQTAILVPGGDCDRDSNHRVVGSSRSRVRTPPKASPVVRFVTMATDSPTARCAVNGASKSAAVPQVAPVCGTHAWDASGLKYSNPRVRSRTFNYALRTDHVGIQVGAAGYPARMPDTVDIEFAGPGKERD